ncbi:MAG: hypothetical protein LAQ69_22540 [Acidobacteriia bacterium]|nr:hypothetical protein [Terriglobia bacterium]
MRRALHAYAAAAAAPSFALGALAEAQARVVLLRESRRRMATWGHGRDSKVRLAEWVVTPAGARIERLLREAIQRVEKLEAGIRPQAGETGGTACPTTE